MEREPKTPASKGKDERLTFSQLTSRLHEEMLELQKVRERLGKPKKEPKARATIDPDAPRRLMIQHHPPLESSDKTPTGLSSHGQKKNSDTKSRIRRTKRRVVTGQVLSPPEHPRTEK